MKCLKPKNFPLKSVPFLFRSMALSFDPSTLGASPAVTSFTHEQALIANSNPLSPRPTNVISGPLSPVSESSYEPLGSAPLSPQVSASTGVSQVTRKKSALRETFRTYRRFNPSSVNPSFPCLKESGDYQYLRNDQIVVRAEYKRKDGQVTRDFFVADPLSLLTDVMLKESFRDYHEIFLESRPMKFFFDIDAGEEGGLFRDKENCIRLMLDVVNSASIALARVVGVLQNDIEKGVRYFTSSSDEKESYHIIFSNVMCDPVPHNGKLSSMPVLKNLYDAVFEDIAQRYQGLASRELLAKVLDPGPYSSGKSLRMPYSYKGGKRRLHWMPVEISDLNTLKPSDSVDVFLAGLISFDHGAEYRYTAKGFASTTPRSALHTKEREDIISAVYLHMGDRVKARDNETRSCVSFDRVNPDDRFACPGCGEIHESDNFYAYLSKGEIMIRCYRNMDRSTKLGRVREVSSDERKQVEGYFSWEHSKDDLVALLEAAEADPNAVCDDCGKHLCECEDLLDDQSEYDLPRPLPLIVGEAPRLIAAQEPPLPLFKIDMNDPYTVRDFCVQFMNNDNPVVFNTRDECARWILTVFVANLRRVFVYLQDGPGLAIKELKGGKPVLSFYGKDGGKMLRDYPQKGRFGYSDETGVVKMFTLGFGDYFGKYRDNFFAIGSTELRIPGYHLPCPFDTVDLLPSLSARFLGRYDPARIQYTLRHLREVISAGNEEYYRFLVKTLAYPLRTGQKSQVVPVICGAGGIGKSVFFSQFALQVYGLNHALSELAFDSIKAAAADFALDSKRFVVINECGMISGESMKIFDALKERLTGDQLQIKKLYRDVYYSPNHLNFVILSNHRNCVPGGAGHSRRFAPIEAIGGSKENLREVVREILTEGWGDHFLTYLLTDPEIDCSNLPAPTEDEIPDTQLRVQQQEASVPPHVAFERELFERDLLSDVIVRKGKAYITSDELREMISTVIGKEITPNVNVRHYLQGSEHHPVFLPCMKRMDINGKSSRMYEIVSEHYDRLKVELFNGETVTISEMIQRDAAPPGDDLHRLKLV